MPDDTRPSVWFWQRSLTPHMAGLAAALAEQGFPVVFVANIVLSADRVALGWHVAEFGGATIHLAPDRSTVQTLAATAPPESVHLCQGLRGNGLVSVAQTVLAARGLGFWVIAETVDDRMWQGFIKRMWYRYLLWKISTHLHGILAIGRETLQWFVARSAPANRVFPFAYFIQRPTDWVDHALQFDATSRPYRFVFVGQLIPRKNVDQLIMAIASLSDAEIELWVIGSGPEEARLRVLAQERLPNQVTWFGRKPMTEVPQLIAESDCLVLPSRHDGWGAVVSEAMIVGTPVICSDACGSSIVVRASGVGAVFPANNQQALSEVLRTQYLAGPWGSDRRQRLAAWAKCLGAQAGAVYLSSILRGNEMNGVKPMPPWESGFDQSSDGV